MVGGAPTKLSAVVIGCGGIGALAEDEVVRPKPATHCGAWAAHPRVLLSATVDKDFASAKAAGLRFKAPYSFGTISQAMEAVHPDIVSVATPVETHLDLVLGAAVGRPRAIVCEKPLATSVKDGEVMVEECRRRGVRLFVNHVRRFDADLQNENLRLAKTVGEPQTAVGWYSGGLRDGGTHMIDLMRMFLGEVEVLAAHGTGALPDALLRFHSGARGTLIGHDIGEHVVFDLVITGSRGRLSILRGGLELKWERATEGYPLAAGYQHLVPAGGWTQPGGRSFFTGLAEHVVAVLDGREAAVSTGEDGVAALRIIEAIEAR